VESILLPELLPQFGISHSEKEETSRQEGLEEDEGTSKEGEPSISIPNPRNIQTTE